MHLCYKWEGLSSWNNFPRKWSRVLGSVCRRELADAPPGFALTSDQNVAKTAGFELWGTLLGPISRNNFAVWAPPIFHRSSVHQLVSSLLPPYLFKHFVLLFHFLVFLRGEMLSTDSSLLLLRLPDSFPRASRAFQQTFVFLPQIICCGSFYLLSILFFFSFFQVLTILHRQYAICISYLGSFFSFKWG